MLPTGAFGVRLNMGPYISISYEYLSMRAYMCESIYECIATFKHNN